MLEQLHDRARSGWLAAVAIGLVLLGSVPFYAEALPQGWVSYGPTTNSLTIITGPGRLSRLAGGVYPGLAQYWLVSVPLAYLLLAAGFWLRARRTGLQLRWPVYVGTGLLLFTGLVLTVLPVADPLPMTVRTVTTPLLLLAGSLFVLGMVESDRRLQVLSGVGVLVAGYVGVVGRGGGFVVPDTWPLEPVLSAAACPQGSVALLGLAFLVCGAVWRPKRR